MKKLIIATLLSICSVGFSADTYNCTISHQNDENLIYGSKTLVADTVAWDETLDVFIDSFSGKKKIVLNLTRFEDDASGLLLGLLIGDETHSQMPSSFQTRSDIGTEKIELSATLPSSGFLNIKVVCSLVNHSN